MSIQDWNIDYLRRIVVSLKIKGCHKILKYDICLRFINAKNNCIIDKANGIIKEDNSITSFPTTYCRLVNVIFGDKMRFKFSICCEILTLFKVDLDSI